MAISQALTTSFKLDILDGVHDLNTDVIKVALYTSAAVLDATTTAYTTLNETTCTAYVAGGNALTGATITTSGTTAFATFDNSLWSAASFVARGALIYNSSKAGKSIAVLDFGGDQTVSNGDFAVIFPAANATDAIIRIA